MENRRKLLPYEHQLIDALGVTKEEYLDFVAKQHIYTDEKEGTILDARNWEIIVVALTVLGILFQVAAALLMPKPAIPKMGAGQPATRDEVFAPRFGFNSAQQLAAYGDPVNLVYANAQANPEGGVRVASALIWSAVQSYGNSQLVQLLFVIGAGGIDAIDETRSAFGQTALRDLVPQNYWTYFASNTTGALRNRFLRPALYSNVQTADPTRFGTGQENPYRIRVDSNGAKSEGFSHAYSPTSAATFGVYGVVPVNIEYFIRNGAGDFEVAPNLVTMTGWTRGLKKIAANEEFMVTVAKSTPNSEKLAEREASDARQALVAVFDNSGVFKFGSTKLKLLTADRSDIISADMQIKLMAVEEGRGSSIAYNVNNRDEASALDIAKQRKDYNALAPVVRALLEEDTRLLNDDGTSSIGPVGVAYTDRKITARELAQDGRILKRIVQRNPGGYVKGQQFIITYFSNEFVRKLTQTEINTLNKYADLEDLLKDPNIKADFFYLKGIARIEEAAYETISPCNIVDFSIKARVFKRISGRQTEYGSERRTGWSSSDNGNKMRSSMFIVKFKRTNEVNYNYFPGIFVIRRAADIDNFVYLRFNSNNIPAANWQFKFEPVIDPIAEFSAHPELILRDGSRIFHYLENSGSPVSYQLAANLKTVVTNGKGYLAFEYNGSFAGHKNSLPPIDDNPEGMSEWDLFTNTSDDQVNFSFDNGPEMVLAAVTEQIVTPFSDFPGLYRDLALFGLNMYSGKSVQDLRSFSLFVSQGRRSRLLRTSGAVNGRAWGRYDKDSDYLSPEPNGNANTAPDIFIDTILDENDGIGKYATLESTNLEQLARSKKFCEKNKLFMDCVIAEPTSWRAFWAQNAGYSLLELAKVGGQDVLVPAVPYDKDTGEITTQIQISALFNPGNILEDSYKEEFIDYGSNTQDVILTAIYRVMGTDSTFSRNVSVEVRLSDTIEENALRETVDMSAFVTRREQAIAVAKFLCQVRRYSQKAIEFKTFPTDSPVFPGAYIYVELAQNQWDNIYTGTIESGGFLNTALSPSIPDGTYAALCYEPTNKGTKKLSQVLVAGGRAGEMAGYAGQLFVLGFRVENRRIFRVTEVLMDEEGEVTIRGVEHGTNNAGDSLISRGLANRVAGLFTIDSRPE